MQRLLLLSLLLSFQTGKACVSPFSLTVHCEERSNVILCESTEAFEDRHSPLSVPSRASVCVCVCVCMCVCAGERERERERERKKERGI